MHGEFILSELARRGFTPSYGFPVDVVSFDHIADQRSSGVSYQGYGYGEYQGGASRTLDIAIREYAPGAEIVRPSSYLGIEYSDDLTVIQITCNDTRSLDQKKALFAAIAVALIAGNHLVTARA